MKNIDTFIVNRIKDYFKRSPSTVKSNYCTFFRKFINGSLINPRVKRMKDILFANSVLKCRFVELNDNLHALIIA